VLAVISLLTLGAVTEFAPGLERIRLFSTRPENLETADKTAFAPIASVGEAEITLETQLRPELAQPEHAKLSDKAAGPIARAPSENLDLPSVNAQKPPVPLVDASGKALLGFYRALADTAQKKPNAITRVAHFGDSVVVGDYVTNTLRRKLQTEFGDAGHGFLLIANAWPAYFHNDVSRYATAGWTVSRIVGPYAEDGFYGLGGVSFKAHPNTLARFGTAKTGTFGRNVSRFVLAYLEQPGGGKLQISVDGKVHTLLDTNGPLPKSAFFEIRVPDAEHEFEIYTKEGQSRAFGVVLEREMPGVVYDAIGVQGARIRFLDKQDDAHWAEQLRWRAPNLVVYQFGANESGDGFLYPMVDYHRTMKEIVQQGQRALPGAGCLVIGAMDRAAKVGEEIVSVRVIPHIIEEQRKVAAEVGCAFFDTYTAMGGATSMQTWVKRGLGQADLTHPSGVGAEVIGNWIFRALMEGYNAYLQSPR
jgi:lysophospholipase L1-like esterase